MECPEVCAGGNASFYSLEPEEESEILWRGRQIKMGESSAKCAARTKFDDFFVDSICKKGTSPARHRCFVKEKSEYYTIEGISHKGMSISFINGMNNSYEEAIDHGLYLHDLSSGMEINGVFAHSNGPILDFLKANFLTYHGFSDRAVELLINQWTQFNENNKDNPHAKILHICHSRGAMQTKNALQRSSEEVRRRVIAIAIAGSAVILKKLCYDSYNFISRRDIVPLGETVIGLLRSGSLDDEERAELLKELGENRQELIILEPHPEAKGLDHGFRSKTYEPDLILLIQEYLNRFLSRSGEEKTFHH